MASSLTFIGNERGSLPHDWIISTKENPRWYLLTSPGLNFFILFKRLNFGFVLILIQMHPKAQPLNWNRLNWAWLFWNLEKASDQRCYLVTISHSNSIALGEMCTDENEERNKESISSTTQISKNWKTAKDFENEKWNRIVDLMITHWAKVRRLRMPGNFSF